MKVALFVSLLASIGAPVWAWRRVCYLTEIAGVRRGSARVTPDDVDPSLCTHLVYAFAPMSGHLLNLVPSQYTSHVYERLNALKSKNPSLKTMVAIHGGNTGKSTMTVILSSVASIRQFAKRVIIFLNLYKFDGIDLHFVHPAVGSKLSVGKGNFTKLCRKIRKEFKYERMKTGRKYILAISGPAEKKYIDMGYQVANLARVADFINVLTFDLHGGWEDQTGHHAALFADKQQSAKSAQLNVEWAINYWLRRGATREQLVVGMALYGRGFTLADQTRTEVGAPASGPSFPGRRTALGGLLAYYEVCQLLRGGATRHWLGEPRVPYMTLGSQWVGYDDRASLMLKVRWLKEQRLGGWMAWSIDYDDVTGRYCQLGTYPLLRAMNNALTEPQMLYQDPPTTTIITTKQPAETDTFNSEEFCYSRTSGTYPYPSDCSLYVQCIWQIAVVVPCPKSLIYDVEWKRCISNEQAFGC